MTVQIVSMVIAVILLRWSSTDFMLKKEEKKCFQWSIFLILIVSISELGCKIFDNTTPDNRIWSIMFNLMGFGISPFIFLCESNFYIRKNNKWIYAPAVLNLLLVCMSPAFGWIFYVTPSCAYHRGPLFWVYLVTFSFYIIYALIQKLKAISYYPSYFKVRIISTGVVLMGGLLVQVIYPHLHTTWIIISVYFVLHYALTCEIASMVDGLTGLMNKTVFSEQMQSLQEKPCSNTYLLMIDVNDFKLVNDKWGHMYGDKCLKEIATALRKSFEKNAAIYRFGGDEFCVVYSSNSKEEIKECITKLYERIEEKRKEIDDFPSVAVGYESFHSEVNVHKTIDLADEHMYHNKMKMKSDEMK